MSNTFGRLDTRAARFLRHVMDTCPNDFKLGDFVRFRIPKRPLDHQQMKLKVGGTFEERLPLVIHLNIRQNIAEKVLAIIAQFKIALDPPKSRMEQYSIISDLELSEEGRKLVEEIESYSMMHKDRVDKSVKELAEVWESAAGIPEEPQPSAIKTTLLPHQKQALWFMKEREKNPFSGELEDKFNLFEIEDEGESTIFRNRITGTESAKMPTSHAMGGILADEMGLGKTLTVIAHIVATMPEAKAFGNRRPKFVNDQLRKHYRATLLVVKTSLLEGTWDPELKKHVKKNKLKVYQFHGNNRDPDLSDYDIVLTTYGILQSEMSRNRLKSPLLNNEWFRIVLDEAHEIRNRTKGSAIACRSIASDKRWALSGTPIQNSLHDFGSLVAFLGVPGLESVKDFDRLVIAPFLSDDGFALSRLSLLRDIIQIRRLKQSVLLDLPPKVEKQVGLVFEQKEKDCYDALFGAIHRKVKQMEEKNDASAPQLNMRVFALITKLRRFCTHKQEMLGEEELKFLETVQRGTTRPAEEENDDDEYEEDANEIKKGAIAFLSFLHADQADYCIICDGMIVQDVDESETDSPQSAILCQVLRSCWSVICDDCFPSYKANLKFLENTKYMQCQHCQSTHADDFVAVLRQDFEEYLERQRTIKGNKSLAKAQSVYTGPSMKVKTLLSHIETCKKWETNHPGEQLLKT
jgi:SNF2 family DNA or RNA helicase